MEKVKRKQDVVAKTTKHNINDNIRSYEVRLIGDNIINTGSIYKTKEAIDIAYEMGLDLVETSPNAIPPIAKIVDYKKYLYDEDKRQKDLEKKQKENNKPIKEIQFTPNIGVADIETKTKQIKDFISDSHKVKLVMKFKMGREMKNSLDRGELILCEIITNLENVAKPEALPKLTGKTMVVMLNPKK